MTLRGWMRPVAGCPHAVASSAPWPWISRSRAPRRRSPLLRKGHEPRIANVSSGAGTFAAMKDRKIASYRLSKWALNGFTLLLAGELGGEVSVNAFDPGWVKTDLGGPNAPGSPTESARGALSIVTLPFAETGKFWKDGQEIPF